MTILNFLTRYFVAAVAWIVICLASGGVGATGTTETVIHNFYGPTEGYGSYGPLTRDANGALYGTNFVGGVGGYGTVFKLTPPPPGSSSWGFQVLYSFTGDDGAYPSGSLVVDSSGAVYGTTQSGGTGCAISNYCGVVFKLTPPAAGNGTWSNSTLYIFCSQANCADGRYPIGGLTNDNAGGFYGTTYAGGRDRTGNGTVFHLTPPSGDNPSWTETVLHRFRLTDNPPDFTDGMQPYATVTVDAAGNLYGDTYDGGNTRAGTIYRLRPPAVGQSAWQYDVLYSFPNNATATASGSTAPLAIDASGRLFGTTIGGGKNGAGFAFMLSPPAPNKTAWTITALRQFCSCPHCDDGDQAYGGLMLSRSGALYGTTLVGGVDNQGIIDKFSPPAPGAKIWADKIMFRFTCRSAPCRAGYNPYAGLIEDDSGALYGTAQNGGTMGRTTKSSIFDGGGVIFMIKP